MNVLFTILFAIALMTELTFPSQTLPCNAERRVVRIVVRWGAWRSGPAGRRMGVGTITLVWLKYSNGYNITWADCTNERIV